MVYTQSVLSASRLDFNQPINQSMSTAVVLPHNIMQSVYVWGGGGVARWTNMLTYIPWAVQDGEFEEIWECEYRGDDRSLPMGIKQPWYST